MLAIKPCRACGQMLPITQYYTHTSMSDGYLNQCKACVRARVTQHRADNIDGVRAYDRSRGFLPHRKEAARLRAKEYPKAYLQALGDKWAEKNRHKRLAHFAVARAIRDGKLTKRPCEVCGSIDVQAHHDDYSKRLEVRWLCVTHHAEHHRFEREIARLDLPEA